RAHPKRCAACDKKGIWFIWRKIEMRLFICGSYADASDHAVFPVAVIKLKYLIKKISEKDHYSSMSYRQDYESCGLQRILPLLISFRRILVGFLLRKQFSFFYSPPFPMLYFICYTI
ncbi:MAG: hypothetical protein MUO82_09950, partial [Candidatus Thermoplasmatota archaeon]|nr:hypothetical protein [Candidatus Thermoplasmatota archaeon]